MTPRTNRTGLLALRVAAAAMVGGVLSAFEAGRAVVAGEACIATSAAVIAIALGAIAVVMLRRSSPGRSA
jgi:phosphohistidine swiveling domain-containing protein